MNNPGKKFEQNFKNSVEKDKFIYRLRDTGSYVNGEQTGEGRRFTTSNICDFIYFDGTTLMCLELKSVKDNRLPFSNIAKTKEKAIDKLEKLYKATSKENTLGAYVVEFRGCDKTFVIEIATLLDKIKNTDKKSLNIEDIKEIGIEILSRKLKVNKRYDLSFLSQKILKSYFKHHKKGVE